MSMVHEIDGSILPQAAELAADRFDSEAEEVGHVVAGHWQIDGASARVSILTGNVDCWHCGAKTQIVTGVELCFGPHSYQFSVPNLGHYPRPEQSRHIGEQPVNKGRSGNGPLPFAGYGKRRLESAIDDVTGCAV